MSGVRAALTAIVAGDVIALRSLRGVAQDELLEAARDLELILTRESLAQVLRGLGTQVVEGADAQRWASFMRRGYIGGQAWGPIQPVDIGYQPGYEDQMAETVGRLDEIGDVVDGEVPSRAEISDCLVLLGLAGGR